MARGSYRQVYTCSRSTVVLQWLRPLLYSSLVDLLIARAGRSQLRRGLAVIDELGTSASERVLVQTATRTASSGERPKGAVEGASSG